MGFRDVIKQSVLDGFVYTDISTIKIIVTLGLAFAISVYIHIVYRILMNQQFYNRNFGVSMSIISVITAGIIMAMQSNLVISLGMVGALSIVRFRTAIKDPLDLMFLFWSISIGIVCGAGFFELSLLMSAVVTVGITFFELVPMRKKQYVLIVNAISLDAVQALTKELDNRTASWKIRSQNINRMEINLIIEVGVLKEDTVAFTKKIQSISGIQDASLLAQNGLTTLS